MAAEPSISILHPRSSILVLLAFSLVLILARLRSYHEPPEWDIGTYQAIARELLSGQRLYADAWDVKPPAIFITFAAVQFFTGDGPLPIYLLSITAAIITMLGVYFAASAPHSFTPAQSEARYEPRVGPDRTLATVAGLGAAAFWAATCFHPPTGGNLPNTEVFINACTAWAFALWLRAGDTMSWRRVTLIALLFALASLYKQVVIAIAISIGAAHLLFAWLGRPARASGAHSGEESARAGRPSHVLKSLAVAAAIVALVWLAVLGYFGATGRGWLAWQTFFVAPRAYSGGMLSNLASSFLPQRMVPRYLLFALPAAALTLIGALAGPRAASRRAWILFAGLIVGTHVAVALPGQFHAHYYQLWFVPLSIGAGWGAAALLGILPSRRLACAAIALALIAMVAPQVPWYTLSGREWAQRKYGDFYTYALDAFHEADRMLPSDATFFTWSDEAYGYAVTGRRPPATALWKMHTTTGPLAEWLTQRTLEDLKKNPPAMVILYGEQPGPAGHPILRWIRAHYDPLPGEGRRHFPLFFHVRKGGAVRALSSHAAAGTTSRRSYT